MDRNTIKGTGQILVVDWSKASRAIKQYLLWHLCLNLLSWLQIAVKGQPLRSNRQMHGVMIAHSLPQLNTSWARILFKTIENITSDFSLFGGLPRWPSSLTTGYLWVNLAYTRKWWYTQISPECSDR